MRSGALLSRSKPISSVCSRQGRLLCLLTMSSVSSATQPRVSVSNAGCAIVNGDYEKRPASSVPKAFAMVCEQNRWDTQSTWDQLNGASDWWELTANDSLMYYNRGDKQWWMDSGETGMGVYVSPMASQAHAANNLPPTGGWRPLSAGVMPLPQVTVTPVQASSELR